MAKTFLILGSLSGFLAVAFGAFGAHGLKESVSASALENFKTGAQYQMFHALALLATGILLQSSNRSAWITAGWCFAVGTVIFSGCLYLLVLTGQRWLGAVVPIGGTALLLGWICLAWGSFRN